jgi:predicted 3-demethylubiquinone-9 3-methyltransferase (glyoxalase superfamily)
MSFRREAGQNQASEYEEDPVTDKGFITCLWFDDNGEEAANYYMNIFPDSKPGRVSHYPEGGMGQPGAVMAVEFEINGQKFLALNGGKQDFGFNESISFQVMCADQDEVDYYWSRLSDGGREVACGWVTDRYGVSWQVVPSVLLDMISDADPAKAGRVTEAMLKMTKFDVGEIERAYAGE